MDNCFQSGLLPLKDAIDFMIKALIPLRACEKVTLGNALDRVLCDPVYSAINVPGHDNSAMDGYAVRHQDLDSNRSLTLIGNSLAGHPFAGELYPGACVRIMTGAIIPKGADTVVIQENASVQGGSVAIHQPAKLGQHIRRAGEDILLNSLVLERGKRITPIDIGLLASIGIAEIKVYRRLRVAVFSTGDEIKPLSEKLKVGEIYDSNRPALLALLSRLAIDIIDLGCIADDPAKIKAAFEIAVQQADVVMSSGGVSVGDADYTKAVLETLGEINFWKVAIKPGKPFAFGELHKNNSPASKTWFFGLPGNPVSALVTYHQLVVPALRYLAGETFEAPPALSVACQSGLKKQAGRTDYQRGTLGFQDGENQVVTTGNQSSGVLSSFAQANCYIVLEQARGSVTAGEKVNVVMFDKFLL